MFGLDYFPDNPYIGNILCLGIIRDICRLHQGNMFFDIQFLYEIRLSLVQVHRAVMKLEEGIAGGNGLHYLITPADVQHGIIKLGSRPDIDILGRM